MVVLAGRQATNNPAISQKLIKFYAGATQNEISVFFASVHFCFTSFLDEMFI
jgi:hypothetical protein